MKKCAINFLGLLFILNFVSCTESKKKQYLNVLAETNSKKISFKLSAEFYSDGYIRYDSKDGEYLLRVYNIKNEIIAEKKIKFLPMAEPLVHVKDKKSELESEKDRAYLISQDFEFSDNPYKVVLSKDGVQLQEILVTQGDSVD